MELLHLHCHQLLLQKVVTIGFIAGTNSTVAAAAANLLNGVIINAATSVLTSPSNKQTFTFVTGTAVTGDYIDLYSDGVKWEFFAVTSANGGITIA